jgi:hypothetical protein
MRQKTSEDKPRSRDPGDLGAAAAFVLACGEIAAAALLSFGSVTERTRGHRGWLAAVPVIAVNACAFIGQLGYWRAHLPPSEQVLVAATLESIAIYLAWQAHLALLADDAALRLRLAAYGTAVVIGALNYAHYMAPHGRPTVPAVTFALMSVLSPWLWSVHSRRVSRDDLKARGLIEDHAVRLGATRWFFHAYRSLRVMFAATWAGENRPAEAIKLYVPRRERKAAAEKAAAEKAAAEKPARPVKAASQPAAPAPEAPLPVPAREPRPDRERAARTGLAAARSETERNLIRELIATGPELWPSQQALADRSFGGSRTTARRVIALARAEAGLNGNGGGHRVRANGS